MRIHSIGFGIWVGTLLLLSAGMYGQNSVQVTGVVRSPFDGGPVVNAVVTATSLTTSVETDSTGSFTLELPAAEGSVRAWAEGFYPDEQRVDGATTLLFVLIPQSKINYQPGQLAKATNVYSLKRSDLSEGALWVGQSIQNRIPGLQVVNQSGMPGEGYTIQARGIKSFAGTNAPLVVVDGMPFFPDYSASKVIGGYSSDVLKLFSSSDVKRISFLQGAEASVYGSLGAGGVLLIETDDAADLETRVEYSARFGLALRSKGLPVLNRADYREFIGRTALTRYDDMAEVLQEFPFLKDDPNYYYNFLYNNATDWQKEISRPASIMDNNVRIKGGDAIAKYNLAFGFLDERGVVDNTSLTRYTMKLNANINVSQHLELYAHTALAYYNNKLQEQGLNRETNPLLAALFKSPLLHPNQKDFNNNVLPALAPIRDASGNISVNNAVSNPVALVEQSQVESQAYDVLMNLGLRYSVTSDWTLNGMLGLYQNYNRENVFFPGLTERTLMPLMEGLADNTVRLGIGETSNLFYRITSDYKLRLDDVHRLSLSGGWQGLQSRREYDSGSGRNTSSDFYRTLGNVSSIGRLFDGYINEWNWMNAYAGLTYLYKDLATAGLVASFDGSSSSGSKAPRFGFFPAVNVAWHLKNTSYFKPLAWMNGLNIRAEAVGTGNSTFSSSMGQYYYNNQVFRQLSGIVRANIPNTQLEWEKSLSFNVGLDASLFNHRLDVSVDFYRSRSSDVIIGRMVSPVFGFASVMDNLAEIENQGLEFSGQYYALHQRDYHWVVGAVFSTNKNRILSLGGEAPILQEFADGSALISREGGPVYSFYGHRAQGVYVTDNDASSDGYKDFAGRSFQGGDMRFLDVNVDDVIDEKDRQVIGDPNPDFFGSFFSSLRYRDFELHADFIYSYGNTAYNAVRREGEAMKDFKNQLSSVGRAWYYEGQETDVPRAVYGDPMGNSRFSTRWLEDASFLKMRELTLSYDFSNEFLSFVKGGRIYVSGENLFVWTDYLGADPEFFYSYNSAMQGFDLGKVPHPRTYKIGFRLQF